MKVILDHDKFFGNKLKTERTYNILLRAQAEQLKLPEVLATFQKMKVLLPPLLSIFCRVALLLAQF